MRLCLTFLLAFLLSLNAAYAAVVGVCDALEHTQSHTVHFGHHSHDHSDGHTHVPPADPDGADQTPAGSDHHHAHVHPGFATLLANVVDVVLLEGSNPLIGLPASAFISAPQVSYDRPPKAALS